MSRVPYIVTEKQQRYTMGTLFVEKDKQQRKTADSDAHHTPLHNLLPVS